MKEFIEIPFGAKDSELCGWEYTIPKGYTASIENGKIIVKKEENEDEKIRMALIHYFSHPENTSFEYWEAINKSIWIERGIEYYPKDDVILFIRCPKCGRENYTPAVYNGDCAWCGAKGRDYLKKWKDGNKNTNTQNKNP